MEIRLVVLQGEHQGREIPLPETIFLIGRDDQCHLRPHCPRVSRKHCAIATWAGKVRVRDLQSRNGTYLNGERIQGEAAVRNGDQLRVGTQLFAFQIKSAGGFVLAEPIRDEGEVDWLLRAAEDAEALAPARATNETSLEAEFSLGYDNEPTTMESQTVPMPTQDGRATGVSAGQHLRQYFAMRKRTS
ncbi:MAG: FHA domain-containing protein [Planctomycetaceae bacterium]|nr:FHA domain-containing protein [Planctomycetaceae bacterium]